MKKRFLFLLLLSMALCACDSTRRAQRQVRRIAERCPELITVQAHAFDTLLTVAPVADSAAMPLRPLLDGQAFTVTTKQGTFTATATDDSLTVTYEGQPEPVHFTDTVYYAQVVIEEPPPNKKPPAALWLLLGMVIILAAILAFVMAVIIKHIKAS